MVEGYLLRTAFRHIRHKFRGDNTILSHIQAIHNNWGNSTRQHRRCGVRVNIKIPFWQPFSFQVHRRGRFISPEALLGVSLLSMYTPPPNKCEQGRRVSQHLPMIIKVFSIIANDGSASTARATLVKGAKLMMVTSSGCLRCGAISCITMEVQRKQTTRSTKKSEAEVVHGTRVVFGHPYLFGSSSESFRTSNLKVRQTKEGVHVFDCAFACLFSCCLFLVKARGESGGNVVDCDCVCACCVRLGIKREPAPKELFPFKG